MRRSISGDRHSGLSDYIGFQPDAYLSVEKDRYKDSTRDHLEVDQKYDSEITDADKTQPDGI